MRATMDGEAGPWAWFNVGRSTGVMALFMARLMALATVGLGLLVGALRFNKKGLEVLGPHMRDCQQLGPPLAGKEVATSSHLTP